MFFGIDELEGRDLGCEVGVLEFNRQPGLRSTTLGPNRRFPKIEGTFSGVTVIRTIVFWGLYWFPAIGEIGNRQPRSKHQERLRPYKFFEPLNDLTDSLQYKASGC